MKIRWMRHQYSSELAVASGGSYLRVALSHEGLVGYMIRNAGTRCSGYVGLLHQPRDQYWGGKGWYHRLYGRVMGLAVELGVRLQKYQLPWGTGNTEGEKTV
jgi:hypothetical protein